MLQQKWEAKKRRKIRLNQVSNSQPQGHESDMLTTELPRRAWKHLAINIVFLKVVYLKMKNYDGGNVSNPFSSDNFHTLPNWKSLETIILNLMKIAESLSKEKKTLWEKEKLLLRAISPFPTGFQRTCTAATGLFGKRLNTSQTRYTGIKCCFTCSKLGPFLSQGQYLFYSDWPPSLL